MEIDLVIGIALIGFGVFSIFATFVRPSLFAKREAMKERFGAQAGAAIHFFFYSVLPLAAGTIFVLTANGN